MNGPILAVDVHHKVHGSGLTGRFSAWIATKITNAVGTVACAACFAVLALVALPAALATHDVVVIVAWISQAFLQLTLLPLIMVGQAVQSAHTDARAEQTFNDTEAILEKLIAIESAVLKKVSRR